MAISPEETGAVHLGRKEQYPEVDGQMDSCRDIGYVYLEWIAECSLDPWARRAAQQALAALRLAEEKMEAINEEHVGVNESHYQSTVGGKRE